MSDYTQATDFSAKDNLSTGNPSKLIRGSEFDAEFAALATAVNSKGNITSPTFTGTTTIASLIVSGTYTGTINGGVY